MHQKTLNRLPLVPLSPLIQISREYAKSLAMTTKCLSEENSNLSALKKGFTEQSERLEELKKKMQSIQCALLTDLNIYDLAKEIAYINCSLFRSIKIDEKILCDFDNKQSNMIPLLDFHHYLAHALAHTLIYASDNPTHTVVAQLIQLACILLYVYRDFSGCTAVITCLEMPSVQRLSSAWQQCPSKLLDVYKQMVSLLSSQNNYEAYHHQLWLHTSQFLDISPSKSQMIAVPFMQAHLDMIRQLVDTERLSSPFIHNNTIEVILSESSQQSLRSISRMLRFCQQHAHLDAAELEKYAAPVQGAGHLRRRISFQSNYSRRSSLKTIRLSIPPCLELDLLKSNPTIYHWLVSRAYLTQTQLHNESICVKPLEQGESESIPKQNHDDNDIYWEFFRQEKIVCVNIGRPASKEPREHKTKDTQAIVDQLIIHPPPSSSSRHKPTFITTPMSVSNAGTTTLASTTLEAETDSDCQVTQSSDRPIPTQLHLLPNNDKTEAEAKPEIESCQPNQIPKKASKPMLSPTAPEFIPQNQHLNESVRRYIDDDDGDDDDDDVIILTEEDDEEWTGYPLDNTSSRLTEDEEEWTGYPITSSQDEDEDEDEIWRGYPMPQDEEEERFDDRQQLPSPTSPFTPKEEFGHHSAEEWKGYRKTLEDTHQQSNSLHCALNDTSLFHSTSA
ncbi:ras guanine nucleotide exchange factor domain-containing protein [Blakeslea trispora]|nr:ras guanine nucleotide exchange factor domain-containing protein [Blakeslea trispora]